MTKSFIKAVEETLDNNPAVGFITQADPKPAEDTPLKEVKREKKLVLTDEEAEQLAIAKRKQARGETKSVRLNLLITPSNKEAMDMLAQFDNTSINEEIGKAIKEYANARQADINKIKAIRG